MFLNKILDWILKYHSNAKDFSTEIIPNLLGKIYTYHTYKPWIDIEI